jgi:virulence factor Mce-like protein
MRHRRASLLAITVGVATVATGCGFQGLNALPLPGAVGRGSDSTRYHAELANVGTLEPNSPVMIGDVIVGSVGSMTFDNWHVNIEFSVRPGVTIPANAVATIGQTSLLGSMHLAVDPPIGQAPTGRLTPGATLPLATSSSYPSTEQTLSALSTVVNGGNLGQIGEIIHAVNSAFNGHQSQIRDLIARLADFIGVIDNQRDKLVATVTSLNRLAGTLASQNSVLTDALAKIPPALDVLIRERPNLTTALDKLRVFSETSTDVVNRTRDDLIKNLQNLGPTLGALADVGPNLDTALAAATTFPQAQDTIDRGVKGDYMNLFGMVDLTVPRLKRTLFLGTRWGDEHAQLIPAPGEPFGGIYTTDPLSIPITPPGTLSQPSIPPGVWPDPPNMPNPGAVSPGPADMPPPIAPTDTGGH